MAGMCGIGFDTAERWWRVFATAVCFTVFGIACGAMGAVALPILRLLIPHPARRAHLAQVLTHYSFRLFIGMIRGLGVVSVEFHGKERLGRTGMLVVANHPSLIDVVLLLSHLRSATCVVKKGLWENPLTRGAILAMGYLKHDREALVQEGVAVVQRGGNLLLFPEGTRSRAGEPITMQRGAANIALRANRSITPVLIHVSTPYLAKGDKWYRVPRRRPHFRIEVREDIDALGLTAAARVPGRSARQLTMFMQQFFEKELRTLASA